MGIVLKAWFPRDKTNETLQWFVGALALGTYGAVVLVTLLWLALAGVAVAWL